MAKKTQAKAKGEKTVKEGQEETLTLAPDYGRAFPTYYSNFAYVSHTNSELIIDFCLLALPYNVDLERKEAGAPVVCRVIIPPGLTDGVVKALSVQKEKQHLTAKSKAIAIPISGSQKEKK